MVMQCLEQLALGVVELIGLVLQRHHDARVPDACAVGSVAIAGQEALGEVVDVLDGQLVVGDLVVVLGVAGGEAHVAEEDDGVGREAQVPADPFGAVVLERRAASRGVEAHAMGSALITLAGQAGAILLAAVRLGVTVAVGQEHEQVGTLGGGLHGRRIRVGRVDLAYLHAGVLGRGGDRVGPGR